jgi:uncharacterized membrane protein (UPF0127 family)
MSFRNHPLTLIGLCIAVIAIGCLLIPRALHSSVSYTVSAPSVASSSALVASQFASTTPNSIQKNVSNSTPDIKFEVVTTPEAQSRGLGGRAVISDNYGMLFAFAQDGKPGFWMKDMLTSIDMIWLTDTGVIASITPSVAPSTYPYVFYPPKPIQYVLETRAGFSKSQKWHIGTKVALPLPYGK